MRDAIHDYTDLLTRKAIAFQPAGIEPPELCAAMFPHQQIVTDFLLRTGCGAAFLDTGLGKSLIALDWGRCVAAHTGKPVLMLAPLAVGPQHQREAQKFGIDAVYMREPTGNAMPPVVITNYERLHLWDANDFHGVVLDESSLLKSFQGKTKAALIRAFRDAPFRLACTATPAPNDHMELGNHAEFLGVMRSAEMLSRWFVNDTSTASQKWRLKGHAAGHFWDWVASWARCVSKPSDIGLSDDGFILPELLTTNHEVAADRSIGTGEELDGQSRLFRIPEMSATSIHKEKALTLDDRADAIASVVSAETGEPWIIWVHTDAEADAMRARLRDAIEVRGSMKADVKEDRLVAFSEGRERILITKPSIAGFGLNWQHCARMAFVGMSFSYESYYQAVRRCWRFGQSRPVHVHVAMADTEKAIFDTVARKSKDHSTMKTAMTAAMRRAMRSDSRKPYDASAGMTLPEWLH
jgi:hypothetical protein